MMSGGVGELVKTVSEGNYRLLHEGIRELADMATELSLTSPENVLAGKVAAKANELVERFFTEAVPILDCSVASHLVDEAIKQSNTLANELNSQMEWMLKANAVEGNSYLNSLKIELPEFDRLDPLDLFGSRSGTAAVFSEHDYVRPQPEREFDLEEGRSINNNNSSINIDIRGPGSQRDMGRKASSSASGVIPAVEAEVELTSHLRPGEELQEPLVRGQSSRNPPLSVLVEASEESLFRPSSSKALEAVPSPGNPSLESTSHSQTPSPVQVPAEVLMQQVHEEEIQKIQKQQLEDKIPVSLRRLSVVLSSAMIPHPQITISSSPSNEFPPTTSPPSSLPGSLTTSPPLGLRKSSSIQDKGLFIEWGFGADPHGRRLNRNYSYIMYKEEDDESQDQKITSSSTLHHSRHPSSSASADPLVSTSLAPHPEKFSKKSKSLPFHFGKPRSRPPIPSSPSSTHSLPIHPAGDGREDDLRATSAPADLNLISQVKSTLLLFEKEKARIKLLKQSMYRLRELNENKVALFHALHKATAAGVAALLFLIPFFANHSAFPAWSTITAYCTATTYAGTSLKRCITEALATMIGSFLAFGFVYLIVLTGPDCNSCYYKPYVILLALWLTIFFFSYLGYKRPQWDLSIEVALISFIVILATEYLSPAENINPAYVLDRTSMIVAGVVIAFICSYLIFPVKGSQLIKKGLKNTIATDFGTVLSGVMELYSPATPLSKGDFSERKRQMYSLTSSILTKISKMKGLIVTTRGEVTGVKFCQGMPRVDGRSWYQIYQSLCKFETFASKRYTSIMFCSNQLVYITITLFYGLQGEGNNTRYCALFKNQLDAIRLRFEKMFVDLSELLDRPGIFLDVAAHIQVVQTLLEQMQSLHKENLVQGVTFNYSFDDIQTFSHLWSCLRLYLRKASHLVDSIMSIHDGNFELHHFPAPNSGENEQELHGSERRTSAPKTTSQGYSQIVHEED